jgi:hypothetical protein
MLRLLPALLLALATDFPGPLMAQAPRPVTAELLLQFGGLHDDPSRDLVNVRRVARARDGRFVVVTTKPVAVRVFSARGAFERPIGRAGEGPGEYRFGADIGAVTADSVLVVSHGTRRWMHFTLAGDLVREFPVDEAHPIPGGMSLRPSTYSRHRILGSRGCPSTAVLERTASTRPLQFDEVMTDPVGRTWRHDGRSPGLWQVHSIEGVHRFDVRLPVGITIHQFDGDQLIGVTIDEEDAHHVVVYRVPLPASNAPPPAPCVFPPPQRDGVFRNLQIHARNAMTAGEASRMDRRRYPASLEELVGLLNVTEEAELQILHASEESWAFAISHLETGAVCVASTGPRGLPGWESGSIACSATGGTRRSR